MKKFNVVCIALALVLTACSSDDDNVSPGDTSGNLLGTWIGQDVDYTGNSVTSVQGQDITATFVGEAYDVDYSITFTENPNEVVADGSYSIELTTTVLGQSQTENVENIEFFSDGAWSRSGDELTIVSSEDTTVATIIELTDTTLILAVSETEDSVTEGFDISTNIDVIVTYTKM